MTLPIKKASIFWRHFLFFKSNIVVFAHLLPTLFHLLSLLFHAIRVAKKLAEVIGALHSSDLMPDKLVAMAILVATCQTKKVSPRNGSLM